ncbi:hypothetical protein FOQG_11217 [Fusarium oxysporum f. sp. raphani 54005]|uniref:Chromo shadow domain-containing protein n=2 Tax=Fusarium oxysporum TaxID=5507 RepID=X0BS60_FUSOX|nr:hypothetical protein FOVG_12401 [Fusarium oxysporum f. sp. pisi HDV247]EXK84691.1 hypothetical protein FOQG_11217 [Fusarium oxysporum f. sp. raphani 54005]
MSSREENTKAIQALRTGQRSIISSDQQAPESSMFVVQWIDKPAGNRNQAKVPECELRISCSAQLDEYLHKEGKAQ